MMVVAAFLLLLGAAPFPVHGTVVGLPDGIAVIPRADDGGNMVAIRVGSEMVVVDAGVSGRSKAEPRYLVETGADSTTSARESTTVLQPASRAPQTGRKVHGIVYDSGFALSGGDREIVFFDLGRVATAADAVLWLPAERVLVTGRLVYVTGLAASSQSDTDSWLTALAMLRDLDPLWVIPGQGQPGGADLIDDQIARITTVRKAVHTGLLSGRSSGEVIDDIDDPWFKSWVERDRPGASASVTSVYEEIGGLRTPWDLLEDRGLREGASPTREDEGWTRPQKVLWRNRWPDRLPMLAQVAPGVEIIPFDSAEEALESVPDADAIIGTATPELVAAGEKLRWVQVGSAGVERYLEIPRLKGGDVLLTNGQRLASEVIGEHVMALTRALARGLNQAVAAQVAGEWRRSEIGDNAPLTQLRGKTLLVVGLGGIGTEVARLADAAGMRVTAIRSSRRGGPSFVAKVGLNEDLNAFLVDADVVVNCLPMTPETEGLFDAELFGLMKTTAFFVNVGRGGTVDTDALVAALNGGEIAGAGLDVTDPEPLPEDHPLWRAPNLVITPHFAAWSDAGRELQWLLFRENLRRFVAGERLLSVVDPRRGY
jgi:phosphoglycerate dehydrogenase-like enzyme